LTFHIVQLAGVVNQSLKWGIIEPLSTLYVLLAIGASIQVIIKVVERP
jgi:hypothetical protein